MLKRIASCFPIRALLAVLIALAGFQLQGQQFVAGGSLKIAEYWSNNPTQMKALLTFASAQPLSKSKTLLKQAKRQSWQTNGEPEMTVEAPECVLDRDTRMLNSTGPLKVTSANGKFLIEGEGFQYQQTNSILYISNQVHTIVHPEIMANQDPAAVAAQPLPGAAVGADRGGIEIRSRSFDYSRDSGLAVYHDHVTVAGTNLGLTSDTLTLLMPMKEHQLQSVTADGQVVMDYVVEAGRIHATGEKANYSTVSGLARVTGHPQWTAEQWEGHGDELIIDRTNRIFIANGNAFLKLPEAEAGSGGLFGGETNAVASADSATNKFIQITCDHYVRFTNSVVFTKNVQVNETTALSQTNGSMTCAVLTANFLGTNKLDNLLADKDVRIQQFELGQTNEFTAARAFYTASNNVMLLTGHPAWRSGPREGKGDVLRANMQTKALEALGHAWMRVPSSELGDVLPSSGAASAAAASTSKKGGGTPATNDFANVYSQEYSVSRISSVFKGGVRIIDPMRAWNSQEITILSNPAPGQKKISMVAERDVSFQLTDEQGRQLKGQCDTAFYDYVATPQGTNDMVRLTGNPVLQTTNGIVKNDVILLDHANSRLILPGRYFIRGTVPPSSRINQSLFPKL